VILFAVALIATLIAVPLFSFTPQIYGKPELTLGDLNFVKDYIWSWWQKLYRRYILGEVGPAENATINEQSAQQYQLPSKAASTEPQTAAEVFKAVQKNSATYSMQILSYLDANGIPNKSTQIDMFIVPDNIYVSLIWDETSLQLYDGWESDIGCKEWLKVVATSDVVMDLWESQGDVETAKSIVLSAEANGDITFQILRMNPTQSDVIFWLEIVTSIVSLTGWSLVISGALPVRKR